MRSVIGRIEISNIEIDEVITRSNILPKICVGLVIC